MDRDGGIKGFLDSIPHFSVILTMVIFMVIGCGLIPLLDVEQKPRPRQGANLAILYDFPDASPLTIEQEVTSKIESIVSAVQGVKSISSTSNLGSGRVNIELKQGVNVDVVRFEISALMRQLYKTFHEDVSYPRIIGGSVGQAKGGMTASEPITLLSYRINARMDAEQLKEYVEESVSPLFSQLSDVEEVSVSGGVARYVDIKYDPLVLSNYGVTSSMIDAAIDSFMGRTNIVGDVLESRDGEQRRITVKLKTDMTGREIGEIPLTNSGGKIIYLNNLATFEYVDREPKYFFRINGHNTLNMSITVDPEANIIMLSSKLQEEVEALKSTLQEGVELEMTYDAAEKMREELYKLISRISLSLFILLIFVYIVSRSRKYLGIISITLLANVLLSIIMYYLFSIQLHVFSLAGIAVSFGLIIDSTIVMVDHYSYYRNRDAFLAILAALLTTIGSLIIIFFMPEVIQRDLYDFSRIIIVNLTVALVVALVFVPSLIEVFKYNRRKQSVNQHQAQGMVRWAGIYRKYINFTQRRKWLYYTILILIFGLPIFALPDRWKEQDKRKGRARTEDSRWYARAYNNTIGSDVYQEQIAPIVNSCLGGTMYLFASNMGSRTFDNTEEETILTIRGKLPQGGTAAQLNEKVKIIEEFLSKFPEIERFESRIGSWGTRVIVEFKEEYADTTFPYVLESQVISQLINIGGADWSTSGVSDEGFSNSSSLTRRSYKIMLHGFSYNQLYHYAQDLYNRLNRIGRVTDLAIENNGKAKSDTELYIDFDKQSIATNEVNLRATHTRLAELLSSKSLGYFSTDSFEDYIQLTSQKRDIFDLWNVRNSHIRVGLNEESMAYIGEVKSRVAKNVISKSDQEYILTVAYNFLGERRMCDILTDQIIEEFNQTLPLGYRCSNKSSGWYKNESSQYWLILLIVVIIFFMCSILFESLTQPLVIISLIPVSFIGVFLTFYLTGVKFGTGGFASLVLLSGLVVNAAIYIINEYNAICRESKREEQSRVELYIKAYNHKIVPVFLTVISTVLGLIPFLLDGPSETFWFPFAIGTSGGLIFSVLALIFVMPIFMPLMPRKKSLVSDKKYV